jgi:exopolysaccharide biosynthesis WecB/TagA/CpsF family protein
MITVTWANHYSAQINLRNAGVYERFTFVGIDGVFLRRLLGSEKDRSSADQILPKVLSSGKFRVFVIGSTSENLVKLRDKFRNAFPNIEIIGAMDGYENLSVLAAYETLVNETPDLVIIGLGPGLQEAFTNQLRDLCFHDIFEKTVVLTCGGWLDQVTVDSYYPDFAYKYRINWLIRLLREPRRLWRRYTIYALKAIINKRKISEMFMKANGYQDLENSERNLLELIDLQLKRDNV